MFSPFKLSLVLFIWSILCFENVQAFNFVLHLKSDYPFSSFFTTYYNTGKVDTPSVESLGLRTFEIGRYKGVIGDFSDELIKRFYYDKNIEAISIDRELVLAETAAEVQQNPPAHLAKISQTADSQNHIFSYHPTAGIGVDVYILDSGINSSHKEFSKRVNRLADFTDEPSDSGKDHVGHGTYIAGVVASETFGVAKKANIFDVKVTNNKGKSKLSSVIRGLSLVSHDSKITQRPSLVVIPLIMRKNAILDGAVEALVKEGIPVISPAGNDAKQACNYSPANAKGSLTVGAIDQQTNLVTAFSNWGSCVDVFAPGLKVETTSNVGNETTVKSGTSLATGIAAGMVAYFMGVGDTGDQAVERLINYSVIGKISEVSLESKALTANRLLHLKEIETVKP